MSGASAGTGPTATVPGVRVVRTVSWILTFVAIGAAAAAWFTPRVTAERAEEVTLDALEAAGVDDVRVPRTPTEDVHTTSTTEADTTTSAPTDGSDETTTTAQADDDADDTDEGADDDAVDVWTVHVARGDEIIEMRVHKQEGQLVYVDDLIGEDRDQRLLTDEQWEVVRSYESGGINPWVRRNVAGSVAAVLIVIVGFLLAKGSVVQRVADAKRDSA